MPLKFIHLSDTHLGYKRFYRLARNGHNQREMDVCAAFDEAVGKIIEQGPQIILISGDMFDSVRPTNYILQFAYRQIKRLSVETGAPIVIISGNHESPKRAETGSPLRLLEEIDNVLVSDFHPQQFNFPKLELSVTCLPHPATLSKELIAAALPNRDFRYNILLTHCLVSNSRFSALTDCVDIAGLKTGLWDYVALGDVHNFERLSHNVFYPGSIEHVSHNFWSEDTESRGFLKVALPGPEYEFVKLTSPRSVINLGKINAAGKNAEEILTSITEALDSIEDGIQGKLIRLEVENINSRQFRELDYKELRRLKSECFHLLLDLKVEIRRSAVEKIREQNSKLSLLGELKSFTAEKNGSSKELLELFDQSYNQVLADEEGLVK